MNSLERTVFYYSTPYDARKVFSLQEYKQIICMWGKSCYTGNYMGLFGPSKPKRITQQEFEEVMTRLYGKFDADERVEVEKLFRSDFNEPGLESGITQAEFEAAISWLNKNQSKHVLEENDIALLEQYFAEHLKD